MSDAETIATNPTLRWAADNADRTSIEFHFPEGDGLSRQVTWQSYTNGVRQGQEDITPEEARDRLRAMAAGEANPPNVRAKAAEYADEFDRRLALAPAAVDEFALHSSPEHKVTVTATGDAYWWQCSAECRDGDSAPTPSLARLAAYHHAMTCGLEWTQVDQEYRDLLAKASGGRWLVRLPVYLGGEDVVEFEQSGLKGATWRCTGCGTGGTSHHLFAIAAAAVHAVECQRGDRRIPPEHYLDEVERAAAPRIEQRQTEALAPVQARLDQREAALADLQAEHETLASDRDAQAAEAAEAARLDDDLDAERARTRLWRIATAAAAMIAVGALALLAVAAI